MSDLFDPAARLIPIEVLGRQVEVPEGDTILRQLQYVAPAVGSGRFCWNGDCQTCRVEYTLGAETPVRTALACRLRGKAGMRLVALSPELRRGFLAGSKALRPTTEEDT